MPRPRTRKTKVEKKKVEADEVEEEAEEHTSNVCSTEDSFISEAGQESGNASQEDSAIMEEAETDQKVEDVGLNVESEETGEEIINEGAEDDTEMETDNTSEDKSEKKGEEEIKQENFDKDMNDESQGVSEKDTNAEEILKKEKEEEEVVRYKPQAFPSFGDLSILEKWQWHFKIFPIDQADMRSCILDSVSKIAQETWMYIDKQNYGMGAVELCMKNSVDASTVLLKMLTMPLMYRYLTVQVTHRGHNPADVENLKASAKDIETTDGEEEEDDIEEKIEKLPYTEVEETATVLLDNVYTLSMEKIKGKEKNRSLYVKYLPEGTTKELLKVLFPVANNLDILTTGRGRRVGVLNVASASNVPGMCSAYVTCHINGCKTVALDWKEENLDDGTMNEEAVEELPWDVIPRNLEYPYETPLPMEADEKTKYGKHRRLADGVAGRRRSDGEGGRGRRGDWMGEDPQVESMLRMQQEMNMRIQSQLALIQSASVPPPMGDFPPPPPPPRFLDSPPFRGPPGPVPLMRGEPPRDFRDLKQERRGRPLQRDRINPESSRHSDDRRASRDRSESKKAEPEGGKKERGPRVSRWDTEGDSQPKRGLLDRPTSRDSDSKRFDDRRRGFDGGREFGFDNRGRGDMYDDGPPRGRFGGDRGGRFGGDRGGRFGGDRGGRFGDRGGRFGGDRGGRGGDRDMPFGGDGRGDRFSGNRGGQFDHGGPFEGGNQGGRFGDRGGEFGGRFGGDRGSHFGGGDRFGGNRFENRGRGGRFGDRGGSAFGNRGGFGNSGRPSGNQEQQNSSRGRGSFQNKADNRGGFNNNQRGGFGKQGQYTEKGSNKGSLGNQQSMGGNQNNFGNRESYTKQQQSGGSRQSFGNQNNMGNQQTYQQQGNYGNQPNMYGGQQNNYGNQQNNYGNQQSNFGNQQNNYGSQQDNYGNQQNYLTQQGSYDSQQGNFNNQQSGYGNQQQNFNNLQNNLTNQGGYGVQQNSMNQYTNQQQSSGQQGSHTGSATQTYSAASTSGSEGFWGQGMDYSQYTSQGYSTGQMDMSQSTYSTQDNAGQQNWQTGQVQGTDYGVSSQNYTAQNYSTQQTTNQMGMGSTSQSAMGSGISADATFANQGFYGTTQTQDVTSTYGAYSTSDSTGYSTGNQSASQGQQQYNMTTAYNFAQYPSTS